MRRVMRVLVPLSSMLLAVPLPAQTLSYYTQGYFTSATFAPCNQASPIPVDGPTGATCAGMGFLLAFTPSTAINIANGSIVSLGHFSLTGTGTVDVPPSQVFFHLLVNQTSPVTGTGAFIGSLSGTVSTMSGDFSSLIWTPNQNVAIDAETYKLVFDNIGPAANMGLGIPINNTRGIDALVTVTSTPEPGSYAMVGSGLFVLIGFGSRRRWQVARRA